MEKQVNQKKNIINKSSTFTKNKIFNKLLKSAEKSLSKEKINNRKISPIKLVFSKSNINQISKILSFLEFKDIINLQRVNKDFQQLFRNKKILREYALTGVMSSTNRLLFYETFINIEELKSNLLKELAKYNIKTNIYRNILNIANEFKVKDEKFSYISEQIKKDINRTFYTEKFKIGNGKIILNNILTAIAFIRPEIGYCQGMNFIVGALINFIDDEEKCFWIFLYFIDCLELKMLYLQNMPDYLIKLYQLNYYIKENYPKLLPHLKINQINPDIFFSKWILTIFSNFVTFDTLYNIWDLFLIDKWKAIFKFSIIMIHYMQDDLMNLDLFTFSSYIRNNANINLLKFSDLSKYYNKYKVTNKKILELREDFLVEDLKTKLEINKIEWDNSQNDYVNNYQVNLNNFINNLKKPIEKLQQQISIINIECEQKYKKYEKKLAEVNVLKAKLEKEIEIKTEYENNLKQCMSELPTEAETVPTNPNQNNNVEYSLSNKNLEKIDKNTSPINVKKEFNKIQKSKSMKKKNLQFSFNIKKIIKRDLNKSNKLIKKINALDKEIDKNNRVLVNECQKLDKKQISYEKAIYKRDELKKQLDVVLRTSELTKRELIINLSYKLNPTSKKYTYI